MTLIRRKTILIILLIIGVLLMLLEAQIRWIGLLNDGGLNLSKVRIPSYNRSSIKTIQWFDADHKGHGLRRKAKNVRMNRCEYDNCRLLNHYIVPDKDAEQRGPLAADAVIFQGVHLGEFIPPTRRDPDQVFVFAERETWWYLGALEQMMHLSMNKTEKQQQQQQQIQNSGPLVKLPDIWKNPVKYLNSFRFQSLFNWTMTYRRDSDIPLLYGQILPKSEAKKSRLVPLDEIQSNTLNKNYEDIYFRKSHEVVWLVSDCITKSKRELYVEKLKEFIPVDIFGGCGTFTCPKGKYDDRSGDNCLNSIIRKYKFVLSFENTFHTDYVTEKLFDWFGRDIIQVTYGMADYSSITPPGTVINAADFSSVEKLAKFLNKLSTNKDRYIGYLKRKDLYFSVGHDPMQQRAYCQLCEKLNKLDSNRRTYPNIVTWWQLNDTRSFDKLMAQALGYETTEYSLTFVFQLIICVFLLIYISYIYFKRRYRN